MASTSSPASPQNSAGSEPPACSSPQGCPTGVLPSATLYLYTFLSTLIILLIPRRRENYSTRPRPVMYEAYLAMPAGGNRNDDEERWGSMKPFSASDIAPPAKTPVQLPAENSQPVHVPMHRAARAQMRSLVRLHSPFHSPPVPPPPPPPATELAAQSSVISAPPAKVRVAFLVAMPWQEVLPQDDEEEELPYLEVGVLDVDVVDLGKMSGKEGESARADLGTKS
ncbi:hypothetical protein K438DRAFT_2881 [Mycena galopus ATCC 62051]|nr:hypothetical protein K438DRAFT_2881 [Mycena galopus ATCC 62051]